MKKSIPLNGRWILGFALAPWIIVVSLAGFELNISIIRSEERRVGKECHL